MSKFTFSFARNYVHKSHGDIGRAAIRVTDKGDIELSINGSDFQALESAGAEHMLSYALQSFQDAYAGSDDRDAAIAAFNAKSDRVLDGTIGTGGGASARSAHDQAVIDVVSAILAKSPKAKAFKSAKASGKSKMIADVIDKNKDNEALASAVAEREAVIERERKEAAELKKAASGLDLDI